MPRRTLLQNLSTGNLTAGNVAAILKVSPPTVYRWMDMGYLRCMQIVGTRERRIPVAYLKKFLEINSHPVPKIIEEACIAFPENTESQDAAPLSPIPITKHVPPQSRPALKPFTPKLKTQHSTTVLDPETLQHCNAPASSLPPINSVDPQPISVALSGEPAIPAPDDYREDEDEGLAAGIGLEDSN